MYPVVLTMSVSLDGYYADLNRGLGWETIDDELHGHFNEWLGRAGMFLEGRISYELMNDYWPTADQAPDATPIVVEFAQIWRDKPKIVYSRTLDHADWNATVAREVDPDHIKSLKAEAGGDLVIGGANLAATFARHGLIDHYRIYVHPIMLGAGLPLFGPDMVGKLRLVETRTFGSGVVLLRYDVRQ
jgi:dihydrofolate reductase